MYSDDKSGAFISERTKLYDGQSLFIIAAPRFSLGSDNIIKVNAENFK
jgi:hypothetical protein